MPFPAQYSIAGFILLCLNLLHFLRQKKLWDKNTRIFFRLILIGLIINLLGVVQSMFLDGTIPVSSLVKLISATLLYLFQFDYLMTFFDYVWNLLEAPSKHYLQIQRFHKCIQAAGLILILLNIKTHFIAYIDQNGYLHRGAYHSDFYHLLLVLYGLMLIFALLSRTAELNVRIAVVEALSIHILGMFLQQFHKVALVFGFCLSLGITILYLTLNNPYAYIERVTELFHYRYFRIWMQEQITVNRPLRIIAVELYRLQRIDGMYISDTGTELIRQLSESLCNISPKLIVFRLRQERFLLCAPCNQKLPDLVSDLKSVFEHGVSVSGRRLSCPAMFCEIQHPEQFSSVMELEAYIDFQCEQRTSDKVICIVPDNEQSRSKFFYEQQVLKYLDTAIENNLFELYYQPVFSFTASDYVSAEALSRLYIPEIGMISPELFIRIAEANGKINSLTRVQLQKLCDLFHRHPEILEKLDSVKFNISPYCLKEPGYLTSLSDIIQKEQLPFSAFQFEITETAAFGFTENLKQEMNHLRSLGIQFCLDDFGSGYANLNSILQLPVSIIKMDRSLLKNIIQDKQKACFYRDVAHILLNLDYQILAEGIETKEEAELIRKWGIDLIQGFYYEKPLPEKEFLTLCIAEKKRYRH